MPDQEEQLLEKLRGGDPQALGELFDLHRDRLWKIVRFRLDPRLNGRIDADDLLQETYLAAAQRLAHFLEKEEQSFFVWLRLLATQTMIDLHRRHLGAQRRDAGREVSLQSRGGALPTTSASMVLQLMGKLTSPSQAVLRDERSRQLQQALEGMSPVDREILALRHFEELSNTEVAEVLEIQPKAASIRYIRALKRLKEIMQAISV